MSVTAGPGCCRYSSRSDHQPGSALTKEPVADTNGAFGSLWSLLALKCDTGFPLRSELWEFVHWGVRFYSSFKGVHILKWTHIRLQSNYFLLTNRAHQLYLYMIMRKNSYHRILFLYPGGSVVKSFPANSWDSQRRQWQPIPVFLPGESQGRGSLVGCRLWGCTELDTTEAT